MKTMWAILAALWCISMLSSAIASEIEPTSLVQENPMDPFPAEGEQLGVKREERWAQTAFSVEPEIAALIQGESGEQLGVKREERWAQTAFSKEPMIAELAQAQPGTAFSKEPVIAELAQAEPGTGFSKEPVIAKLNQAVPGIGRVSPIYGKLRPGYGKRRRDTRNGRPIDGPAVAKYATE